jgi:hypothetical protein
MDEAGEVWTTSEARKEEKGMVMTVKIVEVMVAAADVEDQNSRGLFVGLNNHTMRDVIWKSWGL